MALMSMLKNFREELGGEIKEAGSILRRIRLNSGTNAMGVNFRKFGSSFNAYDFDAYVRIAKKFYQEGIHSADPLYSVVELKNNRVAIDYNGDVRGIYTAKGRPLAFFRPDFHQFGYKSKSEELQAFRSGRDILFT